jgi:imidazolonepropionase-like amidohydrolase
MTMSPLRSMTGLLLLATPVCVAAQASAPAASRTATSPVESAFIDVNVVPMDRERILPRQTVIIRDGRIARIGPVADVPIPPGASRIEGNGRYLMPGLADMHVHLGPAIWPGHMALFVANGVTTVRSTADAARGTRELREMVRADTALGPTIYTAGLHLDGDPPRHAESSIIVHTPEEGRQAVIATQAGGYDYVKVYDGLSLDAYDAVIRTAREVGIPVIGHVPLAVGLEHALRSRQASIEHLHGYDLALQADSSPYRSTDGYRAPTFNTGSGQRVRAWEYVDFAKLPALVALTKANGVWHSPTLSMFVADALPGEVEARRKLPEMRYVSSTHFEFWVEANWPPDIVLIARRTQPARMRVVKALHDAGVGLLLGTDPSNPFILWGFATHKELAQLVAAGLSPYEAIAAGTRNAAEYLEALDEFGTVEAGKRADLILVDANPLADVANVQRIAGVMLRGRWLSRADLQGELDAVAGEVRRYEEYLKAQVK